MADAPDILWVVVDTARADAFTPYGAPADATPAVSALARDGQAVPLAFSTANWTLPAHLSMLTGLMPREIGLQPDSDLGMEVALAQAKGLLLDRRERYLPAALQDAGYQTAASSASFWVGPQTGFDAGFDEFTVVGSQRRAPAGGRARRALGSAWEAGRARVDDGLREVAAQHARTLAGADPDRPLFSFVNVFDCHSPFLPPRPYSEVGPLGRVRAARDAERYLSLAGVYAACCGGQAPSERTLARLRRLYAGEIRYADAWIGQAVAAMRARGSDRELVVVVTSDHGENFGEGGLIGHACSLDDRLIRVPLVVSGLALDPDVPHSLAELPRLVAERAGLDTSPWNDSPLPAGVVLAQLVPLISAGDPRAAIATTDLRLSPAGSRLITAEMTAARERRYKLVCVDGEERLYDLQTDPLELAALPLSPAPGGQLGAVLAQLRRAVRLRSGRPEPGPRVIDLRLEADEMADLERSMRQLGYM